VRFRPSGGRAAIAACLAVVLSASYGLTRPAAAASKWTRLRTANVVLIGEGGDRPLRQVAERLEQFREVFGRLFPSTRKAMPAPIVVYVFPSVKAYQPFMPLFDGKRVDVAGYFQATPGAYYITLDGQASGRGFPVIFHEYVHLLTGNALADVPVWFNEGLAEYYETYEMYGREARLGKVNEHHVHSLRERFIPLAELLAITHQSPMYNEGDRRGIFYAESWALVHYLLIGNPERSGQLATFLQKYADGMPTPTAVKEAFGVTEAQLEKELRQYVQQSLYRSMRYTFPDKVAVDKDWQIDQLSEADGETALAELLLALRRHDDAKARVEAVLQTAPEHARALAVLARVRSANGQPDEALALVDRAIAAAPADYLPSYYKALVLLRPESATTQSVSADAARAALPHLHRATTLAPSLADAHGLAGWASLLAGSFVDAKASAGAAFTLSPRHEYALLHASARVHLLDLGARAALTALVERGSEDWIRKEALSLITRLNSIGRAAPSLAPGASGTDRPAADGATETAAAAASRLRPVFRPLAPGEVREIGQFEGVDCPPRAALVFRVKTPERVMRLTTTAFDKVEFLTYRPDPPGSVGCGARKAPERVYFTYRPGTTTGLDGAVVAIELLPDDYQP
jgi:tetratricopeptide (TPR) repeat protein